MYAIIASKASWVTPIHPKKYPVTTARAPAAPAQAIIFTTRKYPHAVLGFSVFSSPLSMSYKINTKYCHEAPFLSRSHSTVTESKCQNFLDSRNTVQCDLACFKPTTRWLLKGFDAKQVKLNVFRPGKCKLMVSRVRTVGLQRSFTFAIINYRSLRLGSTW